MRPRISAIIPTLNEEAHVGASIDAARAAGIEEVIVSDGGSTDATIVIARERGATVVEGERIRALQLNRGAEAATSEILLFLHADTLLPPNAAGAIAEAIASGCSFGGFLIEFAEPGLRTVAALINLRTRTTRAPWGDQAQFVARKTFAAAHGYAGYPLMEDYDFARRMKRVTRVRILPLHVVTSGRRFLRRGVLRTTLMNWWIIFNFHLGVSPATLARWYRGK
jgi:rSAM/selenodomain-associated transferase 2